MKNIIISHPRAFGKSTAVKAIMDADNKASALSWWNSLPGGKKRYLKEHTKLTTPELITRFWLANIKPV